MNFLRADHPALHVVAASYKSMAVGAKRIANMYGVECNSTREVTPKLLDELRNRIEFGAVPDESVKTPEVPIPPKENVAKSVRNQQVKEEGYEQYGSW